eukprot:232741-Pleurochrysis_carterae.AAC.4
MRCKLGLKGIQSQSSSGAVAFCNGVVHLETWLQSIIACYASSRQCASPATNRSRGDRGAASKERMFALPSCVILRACWLTNDHSLRKSEAVISVPRPSA